MSTSRVTKRRSKRPGLIEHRSNNTSGKVEKSPAVSKMTPHKDEADRLRAFYISRENQVCIPLPDERQDIMDELDSGSHELVLEHNGVRTSKCRALKCLVKESACQSHERICSPYRLNLQARHMDEAHWSQLDKPNRRFFHVSCFEAIGLDMLMYVTLPPEMVLRHTRSECSQILRHNFHPAIIDWVTCKGEAFEAGLYSCYERALATYQKEFDRSLILHSLFCTEESCKCDLTPARPRSIDYMPGKPTKRRLTDVLLQVLGFENSTSLSKRTHIFLLEVVGDGSNVTFKA